MQKALTNVHSETKDHLKIFDAIMATLFLLAICWAVFVMDEYMGYDIKPYGMFPRRLEGLRGIFTMHFIHGDIKHIWHNTLGLLVMNTFLFYFYRKIALRTFLWMFFASSVLLWIIGRPVNHIGASMLIYAEFAFLFISGLIRKDPLMLRVALLVCLYYGSLVWYIFPIDETISWEGHLSGALVGAALAFAYRKLGPQRKVYKFEQEPELPEDANSYWLTPEQRAKHTPVEHQESSSHFSHHGPTTVSIKYHYKENDKD